MGNRIAENSSGNCSLAAGTLIRAGTFIRVRRVGWNMTIIINFLIRVTHR